MAEVKIAIGVILSTIISLLYCYYVSSKIPKGKLRFISLIPIFYLFTTLPLYFSSSFATICTFIFLTWLANFKLLLFCFNRGPLSSGQPKPLLIFISLAALPCKIKEIKSHTSTKPKKIPLNLPMKILLLAMLVSIMHKNNEGNYIHPKMVLVLHIFMLYLWMDVIIASATTVVRELVGLELEPPSDEPYLSTSLQDLWGKRWNLMVTNILRDTVYLPVRSALIGLMGKDMASLVAVFVSFVVSGLMHELLLYYVARAPTTWETCSFFLLHGVCVVLEIIVKRAFANSWRLPPLISVPLTVGFALFTGVWLFCSPLINNGMDVKYIEEPVLIFDYMKTLPFSIQQWWN